MQTKKYTWITNIILFIIFVTIVLNRWFLLILTIPLLLLLFSGVIYSHIVGDIDIKVRRKLSHEKVFEDDKIKVTLTIENKGGSISFLEIYDEIPSILDIIDGSNYAAVSFRRNESIILNYEIKCTLRGRYHLGPLHIRIRDFLGLFYREETIEVPSVITILPRWEDIKSMRIRGGKQLGVIPSTSLGIGTEFHGLREYKTGDPFKQINWKASARWNQLIINEYEKEKRRDAIILIDRRGNQNIGSIKENIFEYSIKAAISISSALIKQGNKVGLIIYGDSDKQIKWLYPEYGRRQLDKIIDELIGLKTMGDKTFEETIEMVITHLLPEKSWIILISSLTEDPTIPYSIGELVGRGFQVLVISPSPLEINRMIYGLKDENSKITYKVLSFERKVFIEHIKRNGAIVIDWNTEIPLSVFLREVTPYIRLQE